MLQALSVEPEGSFHLTLEGVHVQSELKADFVVVGNGRRRRSGAASRLFQPFQGFLHFLHGSQDVGSVAQIQLTNLRQHAGDDLAQHRLFLQVLSREVLQRFQHGLNVGRGLRRHFPVGFAVFTRNVVDLLHGRGRLLEKHAWERKEEAKAS